jgi:hypothetical protein
MGRDDTTDIVAAFLIGAALGIGATLLLREDDEGDIARIVHQLRKRRRKRGPGALRAARTAGEELMDSGRQAVTGLRDDAAEIVASARDEILALARDGVRRVRAARRGMRKPS